MTPVTPAITSRDPDHPILQVRYDPGHINTYRSVTYCPGELVYLDKTTLPVTLVFYNSFKSANAAFTHGARLKEGRGVVRSWSLSHAQKTGSHEQKTGSHVVSFDRFNRFLAEIVEDFLLESRTISGNPSKMVQQLIQDLIEALAYAHSIGLSSRLLHDPCSYVWIDGKLKLFLFDKLYDDESDTRKDPRLWAWMQEQDIYNFGEMLETYILVKMPWVQRDAFIECFDVANNPDDKDNAAISPERRMKMIRKHPFLKSKLDNVFEIVGKAKRGLGQPAFEGYKISSIEARLKEPKLRQKICPNGNWKNLSEMFKDYINGQMKLYGQLADQINYNTLFSLITWTRNAYEHGSLERRILHEEVNTRWPRLFSSVHELLHHYAVPDA